MLLFIALDFSINLLIDRKVAYLILRGNTKMDQGQCQICDPLKSESYLFYVSIKCQFVTAIISCSSSHVRNVWNITRTILKIIGSYCMQMLCMKVVCKKLFVAVPIILNSVVTKAVFNIKIFSDTISRWHFILLHDIS